MSEKNKIEKLVYSVLVIMFIGLGVFSNLKMKDLILEEEDEK